MKEIEAKILEIDRQQVVEKLKELGAIEEFRKEFYAIYYDSQDRSLTSGGKVIRLRKEGEESVLTFKQRSKGADGIKVMDEYETAVDDFGAMQEILKGLGYISILGMRKERTQYQLENAHIVIDHMLDEHSYIPVFLEIEAGSLTAVEAIAGQLGFDREQLNSMSVADLAEHYRK